MILTNNFAQLAGAIFAVERNRPLIRVIRRCQRLVLNHGREPNCEDPPHTRKSAPTLAAFQPWGSSARYRHAGGRSKHSDPVSLTLQPKICMEDSHSGRVRTLGKRVRGNPSRVQISYPPRKVLYYIYQCTFEVHERK